MDSTLKLCQAKQASTACPGDPSLASKQPIRKFEVSGQGNSTKLLPRQAVLSSWSGVKLILGGCSLYIIYITWLHKGPASPPHKARGAGTPAPTHHLDDLPSYTATKAKTGHISPFGMSRNTRQSFASVTPQYWGNNSSRTSHFSI